MTTVVDQPTRSEIIEGLTNLVHRATREMPVVGTATLPTPWDLRHAAIDALLDELERVGG
jgi:hypothetical protein